jgi:hypothetical protein
MSLTVIIFCGILLCLIGDFVESIFTAGFASQGVLNEDPTVWQDGARQHPISFIGSALA